MAKKQSTPRAALAIIGGLLFLLAAAAEVLFIAVSIVLLVQGSMPSVGLHIALVGLMVFGWVIMVALAKEKLRDVLNTIALNS